MWKISTSTIAILIITFIKIIRATDDPDTRKVLVFLMLILMAIVLVISFIIKDKDLLRNKKKTCLYLIGASITLLIMGFLSLGIKSDLTDIISTILIIIGIIGIAIGRFIFLRF